MASYSFCPGCYATGTGSAGVVMQQNILEDDAPQGERAPKFTGFKIPRLKCPPEALSLLFLATLFLVNIHPQMIDTVVQKACTQKTQTESIKHLCALDAKSQEQNTYSSEFVYWKAWVGAISQGQVVASSKASMPKNISVLVPINMTKNQARGRAMFYRALFVSMRRQYLPTKVADVCSITIYDRAGKALACCDQDSASS